MATQVLFRRGNTVQNNNFTGGAGELTVNMSNMAVRVHDGATQGGFELMRADATNATGNIPADPGGGNSTVQFNNDGVMDGSTNFTYDNINQLVTIPNAAITGNIAGNLVPSANAIYDLGSNTRYWRDLYIGGNTIYLGSATIKSINDIVLVKGLSVTANGAAPVVPPNPGQLKVEGNIIGANAQITSNITAPNATFTTTLVANVANLTTANVTNTLVVNNANVTNLQSTTANLGNITVTNLTVAGNGTVELSSILNGNSNISIDPNSNIRMSVEGTPNVMVVSNTGIKVNGISNLGPIGNVTITGGSNRQVLQTDGNGVLTWTTIDTYQIANGNSNVVVAASGNVTVSSRGVANVLSVANTGVSVAGNLQVSGRSNLNSISNVTITGGSNGQVLRTNGNGVLSWSTSDQIANGNSNVVVSANGNVGISSNGAANVVLVSDTGATVTGVSTVAGDLAVTGKSNLNAVGNVTITGGSNGQVLRTNGNGTLSWATIDTFQIANGNSNVVVAANGNVTVSSGGTANVLSVANTGATVTGNLVVTGKSNLNSVGNVTITGGSNGQMLRTDGAGNLSWATVDTYQIANGNSNVVVAANGNVGISSRGVANVVSVANTGAAVTGNITVSGTANITGDLTSGNTTTGNITANNITANRLTANGNVAFSGPLVSLGDIANLRIAGGSNGQLLRTDGASNLSWADPSILSNGTSNIRIFSNANVTLSSNGQSNIIVVTSNGSRAQTTLTNDLTITGNLNVTGNTTYNSTQNQSIVDAIIDLGTGANLAPLISDDGKDRGIAMHTYGDGFNVTTSGVTPLANTYIALTSTLNITVGMAIGDPGSNTSIVPGTTVIAVNASNVQISQATGNSIAGGTTLAVGNDIIRFLGWDVSNNEFVTSETATISNGVVVTTSLGNIRSRTFYGNIAGTNGSFTGNVVANVANANSVRTTNIYSGNTSINLIANGNVGVTVAGTANVVTVSPGLLTVAGNIAANSANLAAGLTVTGNLAAGNIQTAGVVTANGTITGGNVVTAGFVNATGNVAGGNITTVGTVTATGNVTGGNLVTPGGVNATGNVTAAAVTATGNITAANLQVTTAANVAGTLNVVGNLTAANINAANLIAGNSNIAMTANSNIAFSVGGNANILTVTSTGVDILGNLNASGLVNGNSNVVVAANSNVTVGVRGNANVLTVTSTGIVTANVNTGNIRNGNSNIRIDANSNISIASNGQANIIKVSSTGGRALTEIVDDVTIGGNLTVSGNVVTTNTTELSISNALIQLGTGNNDSPLIAPFSQDRGMSLHSYGNGFAVNAVGTTPIGNTFIEVSSTAGITVGMGIGSPTVAAIPPGATVIAVNAGNVQISAATVDTIFAGSTIAVGTDILRFMGWDTSNVEFVVASNTTFTNNVAQINSLGNIRARTFIGNLETPQITIDGNIIVNNGAVKTPVVENGNSNITLQPNANVVFNIAGNAGVLTVTGTGANIAGVLNATGNVTAANLTVNANTVTANLSVSANTTLFNLAVSNRANLGAVGNITITGGSNGQILTTDGNGVVTWTTINTDQLANGNSNIRIAANGNITMSSNGIANVVTVSGNGVEIAGNIAFVKSPSVLISDPLVEIGVNSNLLPYTGSDLKDRGLLIHSYGNGVAQQSSGALGAGNTTISLLSVAGIAVGQEVTSPVTGAIVPGTTVSNIDVGNLQITITIPTGANLAFNDNIVFGSDQRIFMGWDIGSAEFVLSANTAVSNDQITVETLGNLRAGYYQGDGSELVNLVSNTATAGNLVSVAANGRVQATNFRVNDSNTSANTLWSSQQTTEYVTQAVLSLPDLPPVTVATTTNVSRSGLVTIDGVTLTAGQYVLVKNQTNGDNGVFKAAVGSWVRQGYDSVTDSYFDVTSETTYEELNINGGVLNVLSGTVNNNLQFQINVQNPSATFGSSPVYVTATTKIPIASPSNKFVNTDSGNDSLNNGSSAFPFATITRALFDATFPLSITVGSSAENETSAITWTSSQQNTVVQAQNTLTDGRQTTLSGAQVFASGSSRNHFKGVTLSTGSLVPFTYQSGAAMRAYLQDLTVTTSAATWLSLSSTVTNWLALNNITVTNGNPVALPVFANPVTITITNQHSPLVFNGTGALNTEFVISNSSEGAVRLGSDYQGGLTLENPAFGNRIGSTAVPEGVISDEGLLFGVLTWNSDTTYDGYYYINFAGPSSFAQGALFGKQTSGGATQVWWARKPAQTPAQLTTTTGKTFLNTVAKVTILGGSNGQTLTTDGQGNLTWATIDTFRISNGTSNVTVAANGNVTVSVAGNANIIRASGIGAQVTGTLEVSGNVTANSGLTVVGALSANGNISAGANLTVAGRSTLGPVGNVTITGGNNGQVLRTDGTGNLSWATIDTYQIANGNSNVVVEANGNVTISSNGVSSVLFVRGTGANVTGTLGVSGNLTAGNITTERLTANGNIAFTGANVTLGAVGNVKISGGGNGQYLRTDGNSVLSWGDVSGIANGSSNITVIANSNVTLSSNGQSNIMVVASNGTQAQTTFTDDVTVTGNLNVSGNTVFTNITNQTIVDSIIDLGTGANFAPLIANDGLDRGIALHTYGDGFQISTIGVTSIGNTQIALANVSGITPGMAIGDPASNVTIPLGTTVTAVNDPFITLSQATGAQIEDGTNLTVGNDLVRFMGWDVSNSEFVTSRLTAINNGIVVVNALANLRSSTFLGNVQGTLANFSGGNVTANFVLANAVRSGNLYNGNTQIGMVANGNIRMTVSGTGDVAVVSPSGLEINGNIGAGNAGITGAITVTGNMTAGNVVSSGVVTAAGNVSGANITTIGVVAATGNVSGGNITTAGAVVASGNVSGANLSTVGAVSAATVLVGGNIVANGAVIATGNVIGGNLKTDGLVIANGNVSGGNITTAGAVAATGNVSGGNITTAGILTVGGNGVFSANLQVTANATVGGNLTVTGNTTTTNLTANRVLNGTSNIRIATDGNVTISSGGNSNVFTVSPDGISVVGTLAAAGLVNGNSNVQIAPDSNVTVGVAGNAAVLTVTSTGIVIGSTGNITAGRLRNGNSNITVAANANLSFASNGQANIIKVSSNGTRALTEILDDVTISGNLTITGNSIATATTELAVNEPIIQLGTGGNGAPLSAPSAGDRGLSLHSYGDGFTVTTSGSTPSANTFIALASTAGITVGMGIGAPSSNAIPVGTTVLTVNAGNVEISAATTAIIPGSTSLAVGTDLLRFMGWDTSNVEFVVASNAIFTNSVAQINELGNIRARTFIGNLETPQITVDGNILVTGGGAVKTPSVQNGNTQIALAANGNITFAVAGVNNAVNFTSTGAQLAGSLSVAGNSNLGPVGNVTITGGSNGQFLRTNGAGNLVWATVDTFKIANGTSNVVVAANGNVTVSSNGVANVVTVSTGGVTVAGNLAANGSATLGNVSTFNLAANGNVAFTGDSVGLGAVANVHITGGANGQYLRTDGTGNLVWGTVDTSVIANGNSNITIAANGNVTVSSNGVANVVAVSGTGVVITGTVNATGNTTVANLTTGAITANGNIAFTGANISLGTVSNIQITGGNSDQFLRTAGNGVLTWANVTRITNGISNVVVVSNSNVTMSSNGQSNIVVISSNGAVAQTTINDNVTITGNLSVSGNTVYTNTENLTIVNPIIDIGTGPNFSPLVINDGKDRGISMHTFGDGYQITTSGITPAGNTFIELASTSGITVGMALGNPTSANSIAFGTTVVAVNPGNIEISQQTTGIIVSNTTLTVGNDLIRFMGWDTSNNEFFTSRQTTIVNGVVVPDILGNLRGDNFLGNLVGGNAALTGNVSANIVIANSVSAANVYNGNTSIAIAANGNIRVGVAGTANVVTVSTGGVTVAGNIAANSANFGGNLQVAGNGAVTGTLAVTGAISGANITAGALINGNSNITLAANGNVTMGIGGTANVVTIASTGVTVVGEFKAGSLINGNSNIAVTSNGNIVMGVAGNAGILTVTGTGIAVTGIIDGGQLRSGSSNIAIAANANITIGSNGQANIIRVSSNGARALTEIADDVTVGGNLTVSGNVISVNISDLAVSNAIIDLGTGANNSPLTAPSADDRGISLHTYGNGFTRTTSGSTPIANTFIALSSTAGVLVGMNVGVPSLNAIPAGTTVVTVNPGNIELSKATTAIIPGATAVAIGTDTLRFFGWDISNAEFVMSSNTAISNGVVGVNELGNLRLNNVIGNVDAQTITVANVANINGSVRTPVVQNGNSNVSIQANGNIIFNVAGNSALFTVTGVGANVTGNLGVSATVTAAAFNGPLVGGNSNVTVTANGNVTLSSNGVANVFTVTGTGANVTGTLGVTANTSLVNLAVSGVANLGPVANVIITGGSSGQVLTTNGSGALSWGAGGASSWKVKSTALNFNSVSPVSALTLPANAIVDRVTVIVDTAFNDTPTMTVGVSGGSPTAYTVVRDVTLTTAGRYDIPNATPPAGVAKDIEIYYTPTGATVGAARVLITYCIPD